MTKWQWTSGCCLPMFVSTFSLSFPVLELLALHRGTCRIIIAKFHSLIRDSCWEQMGVVWLSAKYWYFLVYVTQIFIMLAFLFWWSIHNFFWILKVSWLWWFNILVIIKMNFFSVIITAKGIWLICGVGDEPKTPSGALSLTVSLRMVFPACSSARAFSLGFQKFFCRS